MAFVNGKTLKLESNRKFQFSVPNLRYGSGVRFELSNNPKSETFDWSFKFYYGNSKNIKQIPLDKSITKSLSPILNTHRNEIFTESVDQLTKEYRNLSSQKLQEIWTSMDDNFQVFEFLDKVGKYIEIIMNEADLQGFNSSLVESIVDEKNNKLDQNKESILSGFYFLSNLNQKLFK